MSSRAHVFAWPLAVALLGALACGPGRISDPNFGSGGDGGRDGRGDEPGDGDASGVDSSDDDASGDGSPDGGNDADSDGAADGDEAVGDGADADAEADAGDSVDAGDDVGDELDEGDADTWGIPPDVTNEPCEALAQDCFPTHKCVPFATQPNSGLLDGNKCMPILGDQQLGESCTLSSLTEAQDDCAGDGFCWQGRCVPFCLGTAQDPVCPIGWGCLLSGAVALCSKQCDPLAQDCPANFGCYWAETFFDCGLTGTPALAGQSCDEGNDCVPGLGCVDKPLVPGCVGGDDGCCTPWCNLSLGGSECPPTTSCVAFFAPGEAPLLHEDLGVCIAP